MPDSLVQVQSLHFWISLHILDVLLVVESLASMDLAAAVRALASERGDGSKGQKLPGVGAAVQALASERGDSSKGKKLPHGSSVPDPYRASFLKAVVSHASASSQPSPTKRKRTVGFSFGALRKMTDAAFLCGFYYRALFCQACCVVGNVVPYCVVFRRDLPSEAAAGPQAESTSKKTSTTLQQLQTTCSCQAEAQDLRPFVACLKSVYVCIVLCFQGFKSSLFTMGLPLQVPRTGWR